MTETKTRTKLKDKLALKARMDEMDKPIDSDKWRNIVFDKAGKSYRGLNLWPSEKTALEATLIAEADPRKYWMTLDGKLHDDYYSHSIQMPVKDKT